MELLAATPLDGDRIAVLLSDAGGLRRLEGSPDELRRLCTAMEEAAVLARATHRDSALGELRIGDDIVLLGIRRGRVRMVVTPVRPARRP